VLAGLQVKGIPTELGSPVDILTRSDLGP